MQHSNFKKYLCRKALTRINKYQGYSKMDRRDVVICICSKSGKALQKARCKIMVIDDLVLNGRKFLVPYMGINIWRYHPEPGLSAF